MITYTHTHKWVSFFRLYIYKRTWKSQEFTCIYVKNARISRIYTWKSHVFPCIYVCVWKSNIFHVYIRENKTHFTYIYILTETYSRVRVGKNFSDNFPIRNGLKQGDALSPLLFKFAFECAIRRVQVNQDGLKLNGTHQLLACADVNILGGSIHTVKENAEALVAATKEIELEVNADTTKYMVMSREQTAGLSHTMKVDNSSIERVEELKYLRTTLTN